VGDEELRAETIFRCGAATKVYLSFHGAKMYYDALRFFEIAGLR